MIPTALAVLTWKSPVTLERTLTALEPIRSLFEEAVVLCQESDPAEIQLAKSHGFRAIRLGENVGIQNGLKQAVANCSHPHVVLLENDCLLSCEPKVAMTTIRSMSRLFLEKKIDYGVLQELPKGPGKTFHKYWSLKGPRMQRTFLGHIRKSNANSVACEALGCEPAVAFPEAVLENIDDFVYLTNSRYRRWSNRAVYVSKEFFLGKLIPFVEANPTSRHCNGHPELEHRINASGKRKWWRSQKFRIAVAKPGLFGHRRFDRSSSDDKWDRGGLVEKQLV